MLSKKIRMERRCRRNSYNVVRKNLENQRLDRIVVYRTNQHLLLQLIDIEGNTKVTITSDQKQFAELSQDKTNIKSYNKDGAFLVGQMMGKKMQELKITDYVFDRRSYEFHGRVEFAQKGIQSILGAK